MRSHIGWGSVFYALGAVTWPMISGKIGARSARGG